MFRWGIIGAGNIAARFAKGLSFDEEACLYAISGRNQEKLEKFAQNNPVEKIYVGHENLLADADIDAVYLALPHVLHSEWAIKAMKAGKPVLCEKPAVLSEAEMQEIKAVSEETGVPFMEAMKTRFEPAYLKIKDLLKGQKIERVESSVTFNFPMEYFGKSYHTVNPGGGCLLDSGIYCAGILEDFLDGNPELIKTNANIVKGIDTYVRAELQFDNGTGVLETAMDRAEPKKAVIVTDQMTVEIDDPHRPSVFRITDSNGTREETVPYEHDDFYPEIHHFRQLVQAGKKESGIMPLDASVRCAKILDIIREGFTVYTEEDFKVIEEQEKILRYTSFGSKEAFELGSVIVNLSKEYDRGISVSITRESDGMCLFAWAEDSKKPANEMYMAMKRKTVQDTGHSSVWPYLKYRADGSYEEWLRDGVHGISGGAFPLYTEEGLTAIVSISGLHEGKDHELAVRAIAQHLGIENVPQVRKALI